RDKYTVRRSPSEEHVDWTAAANQPLEPEAAEAMVDRFVAGARRLPRLYGFRGYIGRGPLRIPVSLISEYAWHSLMGRHMYVRPTPEEAAALRPEFTLLYLPSQAAQPERDGVRSETAIVCDLERQ